MAKSKVSFNVVDEDNEKVSVAEKEDGLVRFYSVKMIKVLVERMIDYNEFEKTGREVRPARFISFTGIDPENGMFYCDVSKEDAEKLRHSRSFSEGEIFQK